MLVGFESDYDFTEPPPRMSPMRACHRVLAGCLLASSLACGDDDGTSSSALSGTWSYSASQLTGGGIVCNLAGTLIDVIQGADGEFTGTVRGNPNVTCTAQGGGNIPPGTSTPFPLTGQLLGRLSGSSVTMSGLTSNWVHGGTLRGSSITGNVRINEPIPDGVRTLDGSFTMTKQ